MDEMGLEQLHVLKSGMAFAEAVVEIGDIFGTSFQIGETGVLMHDFLHLSH